MENKLVEYFSNYIPLSDEEKYVLAESSERDTVLFRKGKFLLKEGQISQNSYFIIKGCVREYIKMPEDEEKTTNFFLENDWVVSSHTLNEQKRAIHFWKCEEDTTVVIGNEEKAQRLFQKFPRFETISRKVMESVHAEQSERLASYLIRTPEQRYTELLKTKPDLFQRVPQYHIAGYIGVKPESLSRIRKRIKL